MSRRPYFAPNRYRKSRGDSYIPSRGTHLPSPERLPVERNHHTDRSYDRDRYFSQRDRGDAKYASYSSKFNPREQTSMSRTTSSSSTSVKSTSSSATIHDSASLSTATSKNAVLQSPPLSKWESDTNFDITKWKDQKHLLHNGQLTDPNAICMADRPAIHAVYDPEVKKDESKGKTIVYKSYPKDSVPKTKDPRQRHHQSTPKRHKKIPYKSLPIPKFLYDKNSVGPEPPSEIVISGLGNLWNETYLRNQVSSFGRIEEYDNIMDLSTGMLLGIVRVKFGGSIDKASRCAQKATDGLNNMTFEGKKIQAVLQRDSQTLETVKKKEITKRLVKQKKLEMKTAPAPTAPKAQLDAIARRDAKRELIKKQVAEQKAPHVKQSQQDTKEAFVIPNEISKYVKGRPFLFIDRKSTYDKISKDDLKDYLNRYDWTRILEEPMGFFVVYNSPNEARRCLRAENGQRLRTIKLDINLLLPEDYTIEESKEEERPADPVEEATLNLTKEFEVALLKDIRTKIIAPAVLKCLNIDNYPNLKEKIEPVIPTLPLQSKTMLKEESEEAKSYVSEVADDVFSLQRVFPKLPSFKKKTDHPFKKLTKAKRTRKLDTLPLSYKLNFEDDEDTESGTSRPETPQLEEDGQPKRKKPKTKEPILYSSSEEEEEEEEGEGESAKDSVPTTPEATQASVKPNEPVEELKDIEMADVDTSATETDEDYSKVDPLHRPTVTDIPIPVYDEPLLDHLNLEAIKNVIKDDEDLNLLRSVLASVEETPIKGSVKYWAWKQRQIEISNTTLKLEQLPESLRNKTGAQRSEGYFKIQDEIKAEYLPHRKRVHDPLATIQHENEENESSKVQSSRVNRANNRRFAYEVSNFNTENEILKLNQLNKRKKPVSFARSAIHNWGLYALEPIAAKEMIIEYVGERIRQQVAEVRERAYLKSGIGSSYLFRVDTDTVIDATKKGGIARFINHCCVPSCTAKIIKVDGQKRIVIYALRDIGANEELTYDYKFERDENDNERVRCLCGAPGCKGYLN
ncbi:histone methyltransferase SET1 [Cyberlindnera jadinii NRRL Y-1542]|uniref:Histone-lysine N-methyltransferase, H3 lysine-4 specific n=1 Tax=Cyberlindnera jadinii (strain ATCC 18201 / CBS 1600 / BCRC 20928 / JCM 3617 / NBRC 0987 / NRRL Y-1542) TaxID=983966 RepID=A0A1E4RY64_CYBJN|nr:histone H3-K4 methyltransferase Set1 [Cyberlindnera jadinii NRRL Y-1542]ODV72025.1 histone H3-K4 methyltransferase Set1 [Cyberlindnera jadinii NRRL Y-1542]